MRDQQILPALQSVTISPNTDKEKDIIRKCSGCFKCRKLYVQPGHAAQTCPDGFPSASTYQALNWEYANKLKALRTSQQTKVTSSASKPVAAVGDALTSSSSNIVEADSSTDSDFIASIFGPLPSVLALGNRSFSEGDASVSHPTKSKHYVWKCLIDGPAVEFPMKTASLIDN